MSTKPTAYPAVLVWEIADFLNVNVAEFKKVLRRPLRPTDPNPCAGVMASDWTPGGMAIGQRQPLIGTYKAQVQILYKHANEEEGLEYHSALTKQVRRMLYESTDIPLRLAGNTEDLFGNRERFQRLRVESQRFMANEVKGQFLFFSVTDLSVETENA